MERRKFSNFEPKLEYEGSVAKPRRKCNNKNRCYLCRMWRRYTICSVPLQNVTALYNMFSAFTECDGAIQYVQCLYRMWRRYRICSVPLPDVSNDVKAISFSLTWLINLLTAYLTTVCNEHSCPTVSITSYSEGGGLIPVNRLGAIAVVRRTSAKIWQIGFN